MVPDSVADPVGYYRANVTKSLEFVDHLLRNGCERLVFSSSAVDLPPRGTIIRSTSGSPLDPQSPYARTKAVCEAMFADVAGDPADLGLCLRYFNPIGSDPALRVGLQLRQAGHAPVKMIGAYEEDSPSRSPAPTTPTRDGTGIRDYVHVWDLAAAHVAAPAALR